MQGVGREQKEVSERVCLLLETESMVRFKRTDKNNFICGVCIVCRGLAGGLFMDALAVT